MNQLILGDCLEVMQKMDSESIDLIYLDPPFFSNRNYEVIWGDKGEIRSFEDRWSGGIEHYIAWLRERVSEMHRLLKPTGSIYLHRNWHADAYIRVYILDKFFDFKNQIIWHYRRWTAYSNKYQRLHDTIFFYTKSPEYNFNKLFTDYTEGSVERKKQGILHRFKKGDEPYLVSNKEISDKGVPENDVWQIPFVAPSAKERMGYPTQKPEKLLERIILASSNKGDTILDPFVGGGTTVVVADRLNRNWIGIDQSVHAIKVSELRLNKQQSLFSPPFSVKLHKYDYHKLFNQDPYEFEKWIIELFGGIPHGKKGGDKGTDGKTREGVPIQVKQSENIGVNVVKNFFTSARQYDKILFEKNRKANNPVGYIIAFSFGRGAIQEAARIQNEEGAIIQLVRVESIVPIAVKPPLTIDIKDFGYNGKGQKIIEFKAANGENLAFYSWDFFYDETSRAFKPEIIHDTEGIQQYSFKPGIHTIAVKAVDSEGMEAVEILRIKVNGDVGKLSN